MRTIEEMHELVDNILKGALREVNAWGLQFERNPAYALQNTQDVTFHAVVVEIAGRLRMMLDDLNAEGDTDPAFLYKVISEEIEGYYKSAAIEVESGATPYRVQRMAAWRDVGLTWKRMR